MCGAGSTAVARCTSLCGSKGYGVQVTEHGSAKLTGCSADGNRGSYYVAFGSEANSRLVLEGCRLPASHPPSTAARVHGGPGGGSSGGGGGSVVPGSGSSVVVVGGGVGSSGVSGSGASGISSTYSTSFSSSSGSSGSSSSSSLMPSCRPM